jgi:hypothetical protein
MLDKMLITEGTLTRALLKICRTMNVKYDERAIQTLEKNLKTREEHGTEIKGIFGYYKGTLASTGSRDGKGVDPEIESDITFYEPDNEAVRRIMIAEVENKEYLEKFWGGGMTQDDYDCLEEEFANWGIDPEKGSYGEKVLIKEICHKQNEIRKARIEGKSVDTLVKSMQEIMKNSALTPALQNAATSDKSVQAFGNWIRDIETLTPAEWFDKQIKFKDMDGMEADIKDIHRSLGNFVTGSRDFNTTDLEEIKEDEGMDLNTDLDGE